MKVTAHDNRYVHTAVQHRGGERTEHVVWGDVRRVSIVLEPGEVPDMVSGGYWSRRSQRVTFRPETAHMEWKRNSHYNDAYGTSLWQHVGIDRAKSAADGWVLTNAGIRGTNVKVNGELGKLNESALYTPTTADTGSARRSLSPTGTPGCSPSTIRTAPAAHSTTRSSSARPASRCSRREPLREMHGHFASHAAVRPLMGSNQVAISGEVSTRVSWGV